MKFPRLVYKSATDYKLVSDDKEYDSALSDGWFHGVLEAKGPKKVEVKEEVKAPEDKSAPTRHEMELKAKELGIKFDGRTSDAKLLKMIADHLKG